MLDFQATQNLKSLFRGDSGSSFSKSWTSLAYFMFYFTLQEWISPLPDGSLPHLQIREGLLKVLAEVNLHLSFFIPVILSKF